jgi:dTDP-4-amino-4,6-dideoxygalactose transaminase
MKDQGRPIKGTGGADLHPLEGYNFKVSDVNCAIALGQLVKLQERLQHLRSVYTFYEQELSKCPHQMLLPFNIKKGEVPLWPDFWTDERETLLNKFQKYKIGYREIWLPVNHQPEFLGGRSTINSERISKCVFWLPSAFNLDQNMLQHIISILKCQHCRS